MSEKKKVVYISKDSPSVIKVKAGNTEVKIVKRIPKEVKQ